MCLWGEGRGVSVGWGKGYRVTCSSSTGNMNDLPYYYDNLRKDEEARWGGGTPLVCMTTCTLYFHFQFRFISFAHTTYVHLLDIDCYIHVSSLV